MTQTLIPPVIEESQRVFNADETKQMLVFFLLAEAAQIDGVQMTKEIRCLGDL